MPFPIRFLITLLFLQVAAPSLATVWHVEADGSGQCPNIMAALDSFTSPDDIIVLGDGVFTGDGNRDIYSYGMSFAVISASGDPTACIIDCQGTAEDPHFAFGFYEDG